MRAGDRLCALKVRIAGHDVALVFFACSMRARWASRTAACTAFMASIRYSRVSVATWSFRLRPVCNCLQWVRLTRSTAAPPAVVNVFILRLGLECPSFKFIENLVQAGQNRIPLGSRDQTRGVQSRLRRPCCR